MLRAAMFSGMWCGVEDYTENWTNQREEGTVFYLTYEFLWILADKVAKAQVGITRTLPKYKWE
jgi:hypothetical protein